MVLRRVAVLGGGPGGLYVARLLKLAQPACDVVVHEQGHPDTTFGFGVGLSAGVQRNLEAADPDTLRDILAAGFRHDMRLTVGSSSIRVRNDRLIGIARTELLAVLARHAEKAGVRLEFGDQVLMGSDSPPGHAAPLSGFSISINVTSDAEAERVYKALSEGGKVFMPLEKTFWAKKFAMFADRFGTPWMVNYEEKAMEKAA